MHVAAVARAVVSSRVLSLHLSSPVAKEGEMVSRYKKDHPNYAEQLKKSTERRRKRREDPEYKARETARQRASKAKKREAERKKAGK